MKDNTQGDDRIRQLMRKGVEIRNPLTVDLGEEVDIHRISGRDVRIYPGCRIYGSRTVIAEGACLGREGPTTVEDCFVGPRAELQGGSFSRSVFLEGVRIGPGAHVREGCILEERSSGAHCVGLKQTILFPYVTLGSLINFCDCLMAGGTGRHNHSEVGSSYIHFNFTPDGDKATPSLLGDVPRGVMLNQPPIFLGGQGGLVGPLRIGYGNVIAAGTLLRKDILEHNKLIIGKTHPGLITDFVPRTYPGLKRVVRNNILYLANLMALAQWYIHVRQPFFASQELGEALFDGLLETLELGRQERIHRLEALAGILAHSPDRAHPGRGSADRKREFCEAVPALLQNLQPGRAATLGKAERETFLEGLRTHADAQGSSYLKLLQGLPLNLTRQGVRWLDHIVHGLCREAAAHLPSFALGEV